MIAHYKQKAYNIARNKLENYLKFDLNINFRNK